MKLSSVFIPPSHPLTLQLDILRTCGGGGVYLRVFLTLALRGSWWSPLYCGRLICKEIRCGIHWTESLTSPETDLTVTPKRQGFVPLWDQILSLQSSTPQPGTYWLNYFSTAFSSFAGSFTDIGLHVWSVSRQSRGSSQRHYVLILVIEAEWVICEVRSQ